MPRGGYAYGRLNRRPIYNEDELTGPEYISQGIGDALGYWAQRSEAARQERNTMAQAGAVALPDDPNNTPMGRLRGIGTRISDFLHRRPGQPNSSEQRDGVAPAGGYPPVGIPNTGLLDPTLAPHERPAGPAIDEAGGFGQPPMRGPRMRGGFGMPSAPRATPPFNPNAPAARPSIGAQLGAAGGMGAPSPYTIEGQTGRKYQVDPMYQERMKLAGQEMQYGQQQAHSRADQEEQIASLVAAGMPAAEARARVLTGTVRYDETFGPMRGRSGGGAAMTQAERLQIEDRRDARAAAQRQLSRDLAAGRITQAEHNRELQRLRTEASADQKLLDSYEQEASQANRSVAQMSGDPAATAMPAGQAELERQRERARIATDSANAVRARVKNRAVPRMGGVSGGSSSAGTGLPPLTSTDKQRAKTDPGFRQWLIKRGYKL